ncbi:gamma-glutamyltranspeptidase [Tilletiaria anomala UBC 951]|uniref:Glutathione hydrolase n=1 Tax=Tilletiaria anomala (strain ATCC 24038 / CBS 436.72 / UBC 951) TaxID=1037660 RepID=A0A066VF31_TILAU|nr:gamma-glutamyltranspeptidase [Tilletiaria anomala UBC 951]KDN40091.1 gamma-glutamyltranspeptidase [Tilletiaria anomala UBC 951]
MRYFLSSALLLAATAAHATPLDTSAPYLLSLRQAAGNATGSVALNATTPASASAAVSTSTFDPLASLPHVVSTFDANSSTTGTYSSLNNTFLPAIKAPSQGFDNEHGPSGTKGVVATEVDLCSNVGADLLAAGGSAADAIIGAALCVGTTSTFHSNIGGGGFALVRSVSNSTSSSKRKNAKYEMIDFRETMPALGNETMFSNNSNRMASQIGGLAVGIPGELRGWEMLHARHGKLPWADLFAPAIAIAEGGFRVSSQMAVAIAAYKTNFACKDLYAREVYCPNGTAVGFNEIIRKPRYARTLKKIAREGPDAFYKGAIATNTIATIQASGGIMTLGDLANYTALLRTPNNITYTSRATPEGKKYNVFSTVAPSCGNVVLSALKTIDQYNDTSNANLTLHRLIEATKFAYGERANLGDPEFVSNVNALQHRYISDAEAAKKRTLINDTGVLPLSAYNPANHEILTDSGTSQLSVIDAEGNSVTLTTTINTVFGALLVTPDGIILNNEMDDFSSPGSVNSFGYVATEANFIRPGKRPLSSISPVIAEDAETGEIVFSIGSAGGSRIVTANIINAFNLLSTDGQIDIQQSLAMPRWHDQLQPQTTVLEWAASNPEIPGWTGFSNATAAYLTSVGHNITYAAPAGSTAQGAQRFANGTFLGGAEVRQLSARAAALS